MTVLTVPAGLVAPVRSALLSELGAAAEGIVTAVEQRDRQEHPERFTAPLRRHDTARALLETIGWRESGRATELGVDLCVRRAALRSALDGALLAVDEELAEAEHIDAERARRGEPSKARLTACCAHALRELAGTVRALGDRSREDRS